MTDVEIKIEVKIVVENEECGNESFRIEEETVDKKGDKYLEIELAKVAAVDYVEKMKIPFDELEDILYPNSSFDETFSRRLDYFNPQYPAAYIVDTFLEEFKGIFEGGFPNADREYYFI